MTAQNEPARIPHDGENVFAWSRQDIQDAFEHLDTTDAQAQAVKYATMASEFDQGLETFKRSINRSITEAWEGASAEAAKAAISEYTKDAANLTDLLSGIGTGISTAADAVVKTKNGIKPAAQHSWTTNIPFLGRAQAQSEEHTRTQNESDTRSAMLQHYVTEFKKTDSSLPVLPASLNPIKTDKNPGPGVTNPGPTAPTTSTGPDSTNSKDKNSSDKNSKDSKDSTDQNQSNNQNQSTNPNSSNANTSSNASTTPSSLDSTTPSSVTPSSYSGTGAYSGTGGLGGNAGDNSSGGGAGRSVPGTGTPNAAAAAAAANSRSGTSSAGMNNMGGMGGANQGKRDEDKVHKTAEYLTNVENGELLIGELDKTIPGGVIGADFGSAKTPPPE
ncbi:WXG100 family type VII secretion target [Nocardia macrotermitis]|uniref:Uncharacterized protein n=1 Tax=Nocardia macrotermitis TaxID=2585198 RepID=A0A7K0D7V7_9NOCA|nr:WXG100 family type VII secretion target [Nocardia macrotermitis]MQY21631.1 hypothetical protein [Nocardia macrotermitis]